MGGWGEDLPNSAPFVYSSPASLWPSGPIWTLPSDQPCTSSYWHGWAQNPQFLPIIPGAFAGMVLTMAGITLCITSSVSKTQGQSSTLWVGQHHPPALLFQEAPRGMRYRQWADGPSTCPLWASSSSSLMGIIATSWITIKEQEWKGFVTFKCCTPARI